MDDVTAPLVRALQGWVEASRREGVARKGYVGEDFEGEAVDLVQHRLSARHKFEDEFKRFVDYLVASG